MDTTSPMTPITWTDHYFNQSLTDQGTLDPPVNCPYCGATGSFAVSVYINFECSVCRKKDFAFRIPADLEGIPFESANAHFEVVTGRSADVTLPTPDDLKAWEDALFDAKHAELRNLLETTYGFDQSDLQRGRFGFDGAKHEVVLPLMNATGLNVSGVCYLELAAEGSIKDSRADSVVRLSGYDLRKWNTGGALVLLTDNELDRLHFAKLGLLCICCSAGFAEWDDSFTRLLKGREVAAALTEASFNSDDALEVLKGISAKAKRLVRLPVSTLRRRSRAEIDDSIRNAPSLTKNGLQSISDIQAAQKQTTMVTMIHPSQDFVDGLMIYGVMIGNKVNLLTSERELLPITPEGKYQLVVEYDDRQRLELDAIEHFIDGSLSVKPDELLEEIRSYIKRFVVLTQQDIYTVLATWVMGTYIFRVFGSFPYIHLQAEKGSGKTRLMDILHPVCFNGEFSSNQTAPVVLRSVNNAACTMFLDEVEHLRKADTAVHGEIMRILNSGYQASGIAQRAGTKDTVKVYSTYSPKMFAGINEITDTLDQRSIRIRMVRALGKENVERYHAAASDIIALHSSLRDRLYVFGLEYASTAADKYSKLDANSFMTNVVNRQADLWGPLFVIAQLADESRNDGKATHQESLKSYMGFEERLHVRATEEENTTRSLALVMKQVVKRLTPVSKDGTETILRTDEVFDFVNKHPDFKGKLKTVKSLSILLGERLEIEVKAMNIAGHTTKCYVVERNRLDADGLRSGAWTQAELDQKAGVVGGASS